MILDDWQKEALAHRGDLILCTGRQVGKTQIMAIKAAERMIAQAGTKIIIVSLTEDQAKLIIRMILFYLEKRARSLIQVKGKDKVTLNRVALKNKSFALARPVGTTGDAVRGFTGNILIIDEASRMNDRVFEAAEPVLLTTGGEIWMCSTPHGKRGYFYKCFLNPDGNFKVIHKSSEDVIYNRTISASWTAETKEKAIKRLEQQKAVKTRREYGQEYLALFLDDLMQFFEDELIVKCCILKKYEVKAEGGRNYLGVDIARMGDDESTFEVINDNKGKYKHIYNEITKKTLTTETEAKILEVAERFKARKVGIDAGAGTLGCSILDHLLETKLRHKVVALNNRAISLDSDGKNKQKLLKEDLYNTLKRMMELGEIELLDDDEVILSLKSAQYEYIHTPGGHSRIRIFGDYTHIVEGLIRAAYLAKKEKSFNLYCY
jgi:hypothetical protein